MSIDVNVRDPKNQRPLIVSEEGASYVVVHPHPPKDETVAALPFRAYFTNAGSNDMLVNGSVTNQTFSITADSENDCYVKTLSVIITDNGAKLNLFGAIAALTNGVEFVHVAGDSGTTVLHDGIKTNLSFMRLALGVPAIGDGASAFRADVSGSAADSYLPVIDLSILFGLPWGVRLRKASTDRLSFIIKDNVSALDQFDVIGYGIKF